MSLDSLDSLDFRLKAQTAMPEKSVIQEPFPHKMLEADTIQQTEQNLATSLCLNCTCCKNPDWTN